MNIQLRTLFFGLGMLAVIGVAMTQYKKAHQHLEKLPIVQTSTKDIEPGTFSFHIDIYSKDASDARQILFIRKKDGTLLAWYFTLLHEFGVLHPAAPDGDWSTPGDPCNPFAVNMEDERIECAAVDEKSGKKTEYRWFFNGERFGAYGIDLKPVPGHEEHGNFVFDFKETRVGSALGAERTR